jgi:hypothetical protein
MYFQKFPQIITVSKISKKMLDLFFFGFLHFGIQDYEIKKKYFLFFLNSNLTVLSWFYSKNNKKG